VQDGPGRRFDFGGRFAHLDLRDFLDLLPQRVGGAVEQLAVKRLYLSGPPWGLWARTFSAGDKAPCSVMTNESSLRTALAD
jgi:hypothetical protein